VPEAGIEPAWAFWALSILANAPKAWEVINKARAWACSMSLLLNKKKATVFNRLRQMIDTNETREESHTPPVPVCINVFDAVRVGLTDGYTELRHRQNTSPYYYSQGSQYWSPTP